MQETSQNTTETGTENRELVSSLSNLPDIYNILTSPERVEEIKDKLLSNFRGELQESIIESSFDELNNMTDEELDPSIKENGRKIFEYAAGVISFIIYTQYYTEEARNYILRLKQNKKYSSVADFLLILIESGIPTFIKSYASVIQLSMLNPISNIMKLGLHILKQILLKTGLNNETLIITIDTGLDLILSPLLFNPATRALLVGIGVGVAPVVAARNWSIRNEKQLDLMWKYMSEKQSSSEHNAFQLFRQLEDASTMEKLDGILPIVKSALMVEGNRKNLNNNIVAVNREENENENDNV
jgi:hypothetical protein